MRREQADVVGLLRHKPSRGGVRLVIEAFDDFKNPFLRLGGDGGDGGGAIVRKRNSRDEYARFPRDVLDGDRGGNPFEPKSICEASRLLEYHKSAWPVKIPIKRPRMEGEAR